MGLFHGLLSRATTDSPGQGSDLLATNNAALAKHPITLSPLEAVALLVTVLWEGRGPFDMPRFTPSCADHANRLSE